MELATDEAELFTDDADEDEALLGADDLLILDSWLELDANELLDRASLMPEQVGKSKVPDVLPVNPKVVDAPAASVPL